MRRFLIVILIALFLRPAFCAAVGSEQMDMINSLIQTLSDPDPAVRDRAGQKLMALGYTARPMLVKAARGSSPQIASRASELLMKLPWWVPSDPPLIQQYLNGYGTVNNDGRISKIEAITDVPGGEAALLRLTQEEPSDAMSWQAEKNLRDLGNPQIAQTLRTLDLTDERVQVLALAGIAFLPTDRAKGIALLRRAIDEDSDSDGSDDIAVDFIYQLAVTDAVEQGKPAEAINLLRTRARRAVNTDPSLAIFGLFAFRADQNFVDGLDDDAAEFSTSLGRPEMIYALGRIERAKDDGSNLLADAMSRCAQMASLDSVVSHSRIGTICGDRAWHAEARQEFYAVLSTELRDNDALRVSYHGAAQLKLARIAEVEEDHLAAADHLDQALQICDRNGITIAFMIPEEARAQSDWHRLHVAQETGDTQTFDKLLRKFIELPNRDPDSMIEVVNDLKSMGRKQEAESCFSKAYAFASIPPTHRMEMAEYFNNLAWLCARCGEHIDEAVKLADQALTIEPDNYGYIDTAASAYFAAGHADKAVTLEKRALIMRPNDPFMHHQLQRFEAGATHTKGN